MTPPDSGDSGARVGVVGGGQLAAMLVAADDNPARFLVLDPDPEAPAMLEGATWAKGNPLDEDDVHSLAAQCDVVTLDIENVSVEGLARIVADGVRVIPAPDLLVELTDKLRQKQFYTRLGIPTAPYQPHDANTEIDSPFGYPVVWKACRGGYDGRGVIVFKDPPAADALPQIPGFLEKFIDRRMELSVMVARSENGDIATWDAVEMLFNESRNVLDFLIAPARLDASLMAAARDLAIRTINGMSGTGIFGIEMFLSTDGELMVNELAPRTHNSGHYTIEACEVSQFNQQRRILAGESPGDTSQVKPAVMFNLLGEEGYDGETTLEQSPDVADEADVFIHMYGKKECYPGRKMGHVTVLADSIESAIARAESVRARIRVRGANKRNAA